MDATTPRAGLGRWAGWLFVGAMVLSCGVINLGWIGQLRLLHTVFNWPGIQAFLSANSEGFLIGALVGIYIEVVKPNTMSALFGAPLATLDAFLRRTRDVDGVRFFLERTYGANARLDDLAETVISHKPVLYDSRLELGFHDSPRSASLYIRRYQLSFDADLDRFTLGFARTPAIAERLIHDGPDMTEVIVVDHEPAFAAAVDALLQAHPVSVDGQPLPFERIDPVTLPARSTPLRPGDDYLIVTAAVPKSRTAQARRHFVIAHTLTADRQAGRHYWIADRPMFMRDIVISTVGLTGTAGLHFELLSFLGSVEDLGPLDVAQGQTHCHIDHWLVRGQGLCVIWRPLAVAPP